MDFNAAGAHVDGESTIHNSAGLDTSKMIELQAFTQVFSTGWDARAARVTSPTALGPVTIKKEMDCSSPLLAKALTGTEECDITFHFMRQTSQGHGKEEYYTIKLENARVVRITSSMEEREHGRMFPAEIVELAYSKVTWTHPVNSKEHCFDWQQQGES